jgi:HSP20 family molecular chaperone IbpA
MISAPDDNFKNIGEIIKKMLEQAGMGGQKAPIIFNFKIFVTMPGFPGARPDLVPAGPAKTMEPAVEVQRVDGEVKLVTELPGISPENVQVMFSGSTVHIRAGEGVLRYQTSVDVPPAEKDSVSVSFRHGVLEVTYRERPDGPENPVNGA